MRVVAIDGTKYLESRRGCLVFYVLASHLLYELDLNSADPRPLRIYELTVRNNVMVLVPVPLSEFFLIREEHLEHDYYNANFSDDEVLFIKAAGEGKDILERLTLCAYYFN